MDSKSDKVVCIHCKSTLVYDKLNKMWIGDSKIWECNHEPNTNPQRLIRRLNEFRSRKLHVT